MISLASVLARRPLVRHVATIATGTAAAQAVTVAFAPLITRLYGPEVIGLQGVFLSLVGLLGVVAALGYPMAIVLPARDADATRLAYLSLAIGAATALLAAVLLALAGSDPLRLLQAEALAPIAWIIPLAMFASVLAAVMTQWLVRRRAYAFSARWTVVGALLVNGAKAGLGLLHPSGLALVTTHAAGGLAATLLTAAAWWRSAASPQTGWEAAPPASWRVLAREHIDFARYRTPQNLINAFSQSLPVLLLSSGFGAAAAGQYAIAIAVLGMPASLIGGAVLSVFYPRISEAIRRGEDAHALILHATRTMAAVGAVPFTLVALGGPWLFALVFGADWRTAGVYAQWLTAWMFLQYLNIPALSAVPALGLQGKLLIYEIFSTGAKLLALGAGLVVFRSDVTAVALFCAAGVAAYAWLIAWVLHRSRTPPTRTESVP